MIASLAGSILIITDNVLSIERNVLKQNVHYFTSYHIFTYVDGVST